MKIISAIKMIGFIGTILTSVPLFILYIFSIEPSHKFMMHIHVWFGLLFIVFAITNMAMNKRQGKQNI
jgi:hypothetical protein